MARDGLFVLVCAGVVLGPGTVSRLDAAPEDDRHRLVAATLAVQTAMQQGRDLLLQGKPREAVETLEAELPRINGNPHYLILLRDAYRAHIRDLKLAKQEDAAQVYLQRLDILEPGTLPKKVPSGTSGVRSQESGVRSQESGVRSQESGVRSASTSVAVAPAAPSAPAPGPTLARGKIDDPALVRMHNIPDDDPFQPSVADKQKKARELLSQAEQEFGRRKYREAGSLYEKAHQTDRQVTEASRERWAYCMLHHVVEQLNQTPMQGAAYSELESKARQALELAPRLDYAKHLLGEIEKRKKSSSGAELPVQHGSSADGWQVAETASFRVYHNQARELAEQAARIAERTRTAMQLKWFGVTGKTWNPKCELYLHATGADYSRATGVPSGSPGHSSFRIEGSRVIGRRIDLHCDDPNLLVAVLPHETTHTVLAGNFGEQPVPRWADEGMAVLSEPRDKVERHLRNLPGHRYEGQLFSLRQLVQMNEYPEARYIGVFYAQSVSLVDFLVKEKGPQVFANLVRDGMQGGYEAALQKHYGYQSFEELEQRWSEFAFGEGKRASGAAPR